MAKQQTYHTPRGITIPCISIIFILGMMIQVFVFPTVVTSLTVPMQQTQQHAMIVSCTTTTSRKNKKNPVSFSFSFGNDSFLSSYSSTALLLSSGNSGMEMEQEKSQTTNNNNKKKNNLPEIPFLTKTVQSLDRSNDLFLGEDAGTFDIQNEEWGTLGDSGWFTFVAAVGTIMTAVALLWVIPSTGYSDDFLYRLEQVTNHNSHLVTLILGLVFPIVHSGLASLRPWGEQIVGPRMWRVIFAFPSLCLAYTWITYFIAHAHDGMVFWNLQGNEVAHTMAWTINFLSFFFLYPSVFNLKEVAAVEKPTIHLWETGMIRITRHPQFVGQSMWSAAHLAMVGTSFTALTMALLVGHHAFACWNGDRRLYDKHGDAFLKIKERTSIVPFQAIWEGRQVLPKDYYKELLRPPYLIIAIGTMGAYWAHPYMQGGAALIQNTGLIPGGILDGIFS